jgi:hypothetical protein
MINDEDEICQCASCGQDCIVLGRENRLDDDDVVCDDCRGIYGGGH